MRRRPSLQDVRKCLPNNARSFARCSPTRAGPQRRFSIRSRIRRHKTFLSGQAYPVSTYRVRDEFNLTVIQLAREVVLKFSQYHTARIGAPPCDGSNIYAVRLSDVAGQVLSGNGPTN